MSKIVTRFAPSPTGFLHAGNYRTALFSYIFAHKNKGAFLLRIEDTDKARSKKEYEDNIIESLKWLGLGYDGFERQSDRLAAHKKYLQKLIDSGHAFVSKETPREPGGRTEVIRFKNPSKKVRFDDLVRGPIEFDTTELGDFVIARSMEEPVFHLVVVTDDRDMGITHIIRGEDHISNTPRQILIAEALGFASPQYAHIPLLLAPDRSKLSKRKGAKAITEYRDAGFLPAALVNYLAFLGWNPGDDREIMSLDEIIAAFDLSKVQKAGAVFDEEKLKWFNKQYMTKLTDVQFIAEARGFLEKGKPADEKTTISDELLKNALPVIRDRAQIFGEISDMFTREGELGFAIEPVSYDAKKLPWKGDAAPEKVREASLHLEKILNLLEPLTDFSAASIKVAVRPYAEANGRGNVLWPMRFALTGREKSPDPFVSAAILGRVEALKRLKSAVRALASLV